MHLRARTRVDDSLDVFACHGVAGILGALLTGVFATKTVNAAGADGLLAGNPAQLGVQAIAVVATVLFSGVATAGILLVLRATVGLRVSLPHELAGVDGSEHGEEAYHGGDIGELAGGMGALGHSVIMVTRDVPPADRSAAA